MVNARAKGLRSQRKVRKFLEDRGWKVWMIHHTRFSLDIFSLFDGFCIRKGEVKFLQIKTNTKPNLEPFKEFVLKYQVPCTIYIVKDYEKKIKEIELRMFLGTLSTTSSQV